jgi:hypothetical protein
MRSARWLSLLLLVAACEDDLPKATLVERLRLLGAKLEVQGDETRTTPRPGEEVQISFATVFPSLDVDRSQIQSLFITCTAPDRYTGGIPICQELIDIASAPGAPLESIELPQGFPETFACDNTFSRPPVGPLSLHCVLGEPTTELVVPRQYRAKELLIAGIVCESGLAILDPTLPGLFGCSEGVPGVAVHGLIPVQYEPEDENRNPDMTAFRMELERDGEWGPADPASLVPENEESCSSSARDEPGDRVLPETIGRMKLNLIYDAAARERFEGEPEQLELTVYATAGDMERRFTLFASDDDGRAVEDAVGNVLRRELRDTLDWDSPPLDELPVEGKLVRFFVTLRDGRGGYGQADYALCAIGSQAADSGTPDEP